MCGICTRLCAYEYATWTAEEGRTMACCLNSDQCKRLQVWILDEQQRDTPNATPLDMWQ